MSYADGGAGGSGGNARSGLMSTSSSENDLRDNDNGDLPFDMELSGLNLNDGSSPGPTPHSPYLGQDAATWALQNGLTGRYAKLLKRYEKEPIAVCCSLRL